MFFYSWCSRWRLSVRHIVLRFVSHLTKLLSINRFTKPVLPSSKAKLLSINRIKEPVLLSVLMNGSALTESSHIRLSRLTLSQNFIWNSYIESIAKFAALFFEFGIFFLRNVWFTSIRLPFHRVLSTATFALEPLLIVYIFWTKFRIA